MRGIAHTMLSALVFGLALASPYPHSNLGTALASPGAGGLDAAPAAPRDAFVRVGITDATGTVHGPYQITLAAGPAISPPIRHAETLVYYNWQSPPHGWSCFESYKGKQYPVGAWNVPVDNVVCHAVKAGEDPNVPGSGDKPPVGRLASA